MRKLLLSVVLAWAVGASAQAAPVPEVGLKVPLAAFASAEVAPGLRLEASAVVPGFTAPLVSLEGTAAAKLYPGALEAGGLTLHPFLGGGVRLLYAQAAARLVPGLVGLAGVEHRAAESPLDLFWEASGTLLTGGSAPRFALELSLGVRYALAP